MMADWTSPCGRLAGGLGWSSRQATTRVAVGVPSFSGIRERLLGGAPNRFACRATEEPSSQACQGPNGTLAAAYITSQWLNRELSPSRLSIKTPPFQPPEPLPPFRNLQPASRVDTPNNRHHPSVSPAERATSAPLLLNHSIWSRSSVARARRRDHHTNFHPLCNPRLHRELGRLLCESFPTGGTPTSLHQHPSTLPVATNFFTGLSSGPVREARHIRIVWKRDQSRAIFARCHQHHPCASVLSPVLIATSTFSILPPVNQPCRLVQCLPEDFFTRMP